VYISAPLITVVAWSEAFTDFSTSFSQRGEGLFYDLMSKVKGKVVPALN
jgi:hypothetical protein